MAAMPSRTNTKHGSKTACLHVYLLFVIVAAAGQQCLAGKGPPKYRNPRTLQQAQVLQATPVNPTASDLTGLTNNNVNDSRPGAPQGLEASSPEASSAPLQIVGLPLADVNKIRSEGVDVVYLWVNGSDPAQQALLQEQIEMHAGAKRRPEATVRSRFNADRDELRFSLRSLQWCMPWFRHLYIVTNGQVPSWLDIQNPRVTVVPHSSIFQRPQNLPTFNSFAIESNLHRIPGISNSYIMMNDDYLFTKPWTLEDFISDDGHEVLLSAVHPILTCRPGEACQVANTLHAESLMHVDRQFLQYNTFERFAPAHGPQFVQKPIMELVEQTFTEEFSSTEAHKFRCGTDWHISASYKWFVEANEPGHQHANTGQARLLRIKDNLAHDDAAYHMLQQAWMQPGIKSVCINDDTSDLHLLPRINEQVVRFLRDQYPVRSEFELAEGVANNCTRWLMASYGQLPSEQEVNAACGSR